MGVADRTPNTRRAAISEPIAKGAATAGKMGSQGTGQRTVKITERGAEITRAADRPSKKTSVPGPSSKDERTSYTSQSQSREDSQRTTTAPEPDMPGFVMYRDSGAKTGREREFESWNTDNRARLTGAQERDFYPSPLERGTQAEIAKGDKYAGTANKVSKPPKQAQ